MPRGQRVIWFEGMLMAAHHMQQADEHHEIALDSRVRAHVPYAWGVLEFKLSDPERVNLRFKIERLEVVMDDGLVISIPEYDPPPEGVAAGQLFATPDRIVDVYLGIPEVGEDQNFMLDGKSSAHGQKQMLRYGSVHVPVADQTTGKNRQWVDFARKNVRLLFGDEPRTGYSTILIARIRKTADGFELVREHVPPLLNVKASPWLEGELTKLTAKLLDKNRPVGDDQRQANGVGLPFSPSHDIEGAWQLYTINTAYPVLDSLRRLPLVHPLQLYTELLRLAGALTTFSVEARAAASIAYDHDALHKTFDALFKRIHSLLDYVRPTNWVKVPLKPKPKVEGRYIGQLAAPWPLEDAAFYLGIFADVPGEDLPPLMKDVPELVKVTYPNDLEDRINRRLSGLPLRAVNRSKLPFPVDQNFHYFKVEKVAEQRATRNDSDQEALDQETVDRLWKAILNDKGDKEVAIFVPKGRLPGAQLQMFICKP